MKNVFAFRYLLALTMMTLSTATWAQTITTPRTPSPAAEVSQTKGRSQVTVNDSRPSVNGQNILETNGEYYKLLAEIANSNTFLLEADFTI
jgi:hypothetical protein